ncbi:helix-turn-helix transcriptional regulator [Actinomyces wuliandei]|uniref:helix-turn-helix transcriptional regulator n=1 Tax=Actinomyces wuliandei TaxID=2057743 RepID=UPI00111B8F29|nr:hypothetical protein [Actinomyces wuliandei]
MTPAHGDLDRLWTTQDCAAHTDVATSTWRAYAARGQAPAPVRHVGRTPLWDPDQVRAWAATRPGRGRRRPD